MEEVSYAYGESGWRLEGVSLGVRRGQVLGVIGPNGAGKSTVLRIAAGLLRPGRGRVWLGERPLEKIARREAAREMGYLPQQVAGVYDYRVEEVVGLGRYPHTRGAGFLGADDLAVVERCLEQTETARYRGRRLSHLSGGERQRVLLASVLAQEPRVLLLDEPTTGLDVHHQVAFFRLLRGQAAQGLAVAVVTHDLNLAGLFCDELVLLEAGRVVTEGPVKAVLRAEVLETVYRGAVHVGRHPLSDAPAVLPRKGEVR